MSTIDLSAAKGPIAQPERQEILTLLKNFKLLFNRLNHKNCRSGLIEDVYQEDMSFQDPFHAIEGIFEFKNYCESLYENVISCEFDFHKQWVREHDAILTWTMRYSHPKLNRGRLISIDGTTELRFDKKVYYHRDFFDGGAMLYEHIPLMGKVISQIKRRML